VPSGADLLRADYAGLNNGNAVNVAYYLACFLHEVLVGMLAASSGAVGESGSKHFIDSRGTDKTGHNVRERDAAYLAFP
jgi:hypothetical protein